MNHFSLNLSAYYLPRKETHDYICTKPGESGMRHCEDLPRYQFEGHKCNGTARPFSNNTPLNSSCVNWNNYYTVCEAGDKNPFQGAISFDNIGMAWVAIFQVCKVLMFICHCFAFEQMSFISNSRQFSESYLNFIQCMA